MKERIYRRVEELLGPDACIGLGELFIGTIHAYCARVLQDYFGYANHDVLDEDQEMAFILQHGWELGFGQGAKQRGRSYNDYCLLFKQSESIVNNEMLDIDDLRRCPHPAFPAFPDKVEAYWGLLSPSSTVHRQYWALAGARRSV